MINLQAKFPDTPKKVIYQVSKRLKAAEIVDSQFEICNQISRKLRKLGKESCIARQRKPRLLAGAASPEEIEKIEEEYLTLERKSDLVRHLFQNEGDKLSALRENEASAADAVRLVLSEWFASLARTLDPMQTELFRRASHLLHRARNVAQGAAALEILS